MGGRHLQCTCGQLVFVPEKSAASGVRCGACGAAVRAESAQPMRREPPDAHDRNEAADGCERSPWHEEPAAESEGEYKITPDRAWSGPAQSAGAAGQQGTFYRRAGTSVTGGSPSARPTGMPALSAPTFGEAALIEQRIRGRTAVELPGRFFRFAALFYPWLHPNWIRWLGLSVMTWLAVSTISVSVFVFLVIMQFGAFVSLFSVATMATVCLAFVSFLVANFVVVIEETVQGEDLLHRFSEVNWWETLPRLMRTLGAAIAAAGATYALTYPLRRWLLPDSFELLVVRTIVLMQLFPVFLITNLVDCSWVPFTSLLTTVKRLAACVGCFSAFLLMTVPLTLAVYVLVNWLADRHWSLSLLASGPVGAMWLMFYGHWLGRLVRQLSAAD